MNCWFCFSLITQIVLDKMVSMDIYMKLGSCPWKNIGYFLCKIYFIVGWLLWKRNNSQFINMYIVWIVFRIFRYIFLRYKADKKTVDKQSQVGLGRIQAYIFNWNCSRISITIYIVKQIRFDFWGYIQLYCTCICSLSRNKNHLLRVSAANEVRISSHMWVVSTAFK